MSVEATLPIFRVPPSITVAPLYAESWRADGLKATCEACDWSFSTRTREIYRGDHSDFRLACYEHALVCNRQNQYWPESQRVRTGREVGG